MHIDQRLIRAINVNKLTLNGCIFKFWIAVLNLKYCHHNL